MNPDSFASKFWTHLRRTRDVYLFPFVSVIVLYLAIRGVNYLTGRAVVDDPGVIIATLYLAFRLIIVTAVVGSLQGYLIPDPVVKNKAGEEVYPQLGIHITNVTCTAIFYLGSLYFISR